VDDERIADILLAARPPAPTVDALISEALDNGAPDNVTVVIADIQADGTVSGSHEPSIVGSAASPIEFDPDSGRRLRLPSLLLHPIKSSTAVARETHLESDADDYLDSLIEEDRARARRRRLTWLIAIGLVIIGAVAAAVIGYQWTQTRYYVGVNGDRVAVFQGVQQTVGPLPLSSVFQETDVEVSQLPMYFRDRVEATISAGSIVEALDIVKNLEENVTPGTSG
jgi:protein phosphatase